LTLLVGRQEKHPACKNSPERGLRSSPDLTLTSNDLESHIVMNVSSTSNIIRSFIKIGWSWFFGKL